MVRRKKLPANQSATLFKKGNTKAVGNLKGKSDTERKFFVANADDYDEVVREGKGEKEGQLYVAKSKDTPLPTVILKPRKVSETAAEAYNCDGEVPEGNVNTHRIIHLGKLLEMFNEVNSKHRAHSSSCSGQFDFQDIVKWGFTCKLSLKCGGCNFLSKKYQVYVVVETGKPGQKAAQVNLGSALGMVFEGISPAQAEGFAQAMNLASPAKSAQQKNADKAGRLVVEENQADMRRQIEKVQDLNEMKGLDRDAEVALEADMRYETGLKSAGDAPTQAAQQAHYTMSCQDTKSKPTFHCGTYTKKGPEPNVGKHDSISCEGRGFREGVEAIESNNGPVVGVSCLDGDSSSTATALKMNKEVQDCVRHHDKRSKLKEDLTEKAIPGRNATEIAFFRKRFILDLKVRCRCEMKMAAERWPGDKEAIVKHAKFLAQTVLYCYQGEHGLCKEYSLACRPKEKQFWKRLYIPRFQSPHCKFLDPESEDTVVLIRWLQNRYFGMAVLESTYLQRTTNKSEALNRAIQKTNPKSVTFVKNAKGRLHAAVHHVNNRPFRSLTEMLKKAGCPIARKSHVSRQLERRERKFLSDRVRKSSLAYRHRRKYLRIKRHIDYDKFHGNNEDYYSSGSFSVLQAKEKYREEEQHRKFHSRVDYGAASKVWGEASIPKDHNYA